MRGSIRGPKGMGKAPRDRQSGFIWMAVASDSETTRAGDWDSH